MDYSFSCVTPALLGSLKRFIISCRHLKILRLRNYPDQFVGVLDGFLHWSFDYQEGDKFPPLQELTLYDYGKVASDESCSKIWDFSMLSHLELRKCREIYFLEIFRNLQPRMRTLIFDNRCYAPYHHDRSFARPDLAATLLNSLVLSCPGLEHLHISSMPGRLPLQTHGSTLRSLTVRERHRWLPGTLVPSPSLTAEDLDFVNTSCPHLESVTMDMERSDQWVRASSLLFRNPDILMRSSARFHCSIEF